MASSATWGEVTTDPEILDLFEQFAYGHLPEYLQEVSRPFHELAVKAVRGLPASPQVRQGLWDLLRSKDCFVRAAVAARRL